MSILLPVFEAPAELFCAELDTKLSRILSEALVVAARHPAVLKAIAADQDRHAREQKAGRLADQRWIEFRTQPLPGFEDDLDREIDASSLTLEYGCPRMSAETCYIFMVIRGYFGSVTASAALERIREAATIHRYLAQRSLSMPAARTILDNINCISNSTRELILSAQLSGVLAEGLDDLRMAVIDSTAIYANSAWPTESEILHKLVRSTFRLGQQLSVFGVPEFRQWRFPYWIQKLDGLAFQINFVGGKKGANRKRRKLYQHVYQSAEKAVERLESEREHIASAVEEVELMPSLRSRLDYIWEKIHEGIQAIRRVIVYSRERVLEDKKVEVSRKILSLSDPSAGMIVKGQREAVLGYKPQIVRSEHGLITGFLTPVGNAADTACLVSAVENHQHNSGVTPQRITADDGYAYGEARRQLLAMEGVEKVSFSGGTGKAIIPEDDWSSEEYEYLRSKRSSVESTIFVLKHIYDFDRVHRRGIENVRAELLEKILAYNFWRISFLREQKKQKLRKVA